MITSRKLDIENFQDDFKNDFQVWRSQVFDFGTKTKRKHSNSMYASISTTCMELSHALVLATISTPSTFDFIYTTPILEFNNISSNSSRSLSYAFTPQNNIGCRVFRCLSINWVYLHSRWDHLWVGLYLWNWTIFYISWEKIWLKSMGI